MTGWIKDVTDMPAAAGVSGPAAGRLAPTLRGLPGLMNHEMSVAFRVRGQIKKPEPALWQSHSIPMPRMYDMRGLTREGGAGQAAESVRPAMSAGLVRQSTTVIIPTYNRADLLCESLLSVLAQSLPVDRIIVVDDGSTDHTPMLVRRFAGRVEYVRQENRGKSAALNRVIPGVSTSHVWILDDDDILLDDAHARLDAALRKCPQAGIAYGRHVRFTCPEKDGPPEISDGGYWRRVRSDEFLIATMEDMFAHQSGMLVASWVLRSAGPFREDLVRSQDYEMLLRLAERTCAVEAEGIVFMQRVHDGVRGTAQVSVSADRREQAWIRHDRDFLSERLSLWPLSSYLPGGRHSNRPGDLRRALVQRAVVAARHKLWTFAIKDLRYAARIDAGPITADEARILRRTAHSKFGATELYQDRELVRALCELANTGPVAARMVFLIARGLLWRARHAFLRGDPVSMFRILSACLVYGACFPARIVMPAAGQWLTVLTQMVRRRGPRLRPAERP